MIFFFKSTKKLSFPHKNVFLSDLVIKKSDPIGFYKDFVFNERKLILKKKFRPNAVVVTRMDVDLGKTIQTHGVYKGPHLKVNVF